MKLSVLIISYNHERFIAQAVESALNQLTDFEYEIVVGDDCSLDGTMQILMGLRQQNPDRIRLLPSERNIGMNRNLVRTLKACKGEYVALLEGDDHWTSNFKLHKQVAFLDQHPECALCFHSVEVIFDDGRPTYELRPEDHGEITHLRDLLRGNFIQTCSTVFRNRLFGEFPTWFFSLQMGDWPLHILNARHGTIGYIDSTMAAYRVHANGVWSSASQIKRIQAAIEMYRHIASLFDGDDLRIIQSMVSVHFLEMAKFCMANGDFGRARRSLYDAMRLDLKSYWWLLTNQYGKLLRICFPHIHRAMKSLPRAYHA